MAAKKIRIRMYRVGFGDCFLVTLPAADRSFQILVDCGVHSQGDIKTMADVVADVRKETGDRIDIIIATHAHQDHISAIRARRQLRYAFIVSGCVQTVSSQRRAYGDLRLTHRQPRSIGNGYPHRRRQRRRCHPPDRQHLP